MTKQKKFFIGVDSDGECYLHYVTGLEEFKIFDNESQKFDFWIAETGCKRCDALLRGFTAEDFNLRSGEFVEINFGDVHETDLPICER